MRFHPRPAGPRPRRASGSTTPWSFQPREIDRRLGRDALATVTAAHLKVVPLPKAIGLVVLSFETIPAALDRLAEIVATGPVAVEMLDRMILDLAGSNPLYSKKITFAEGRPAAVLAAQFYADSAEELAERAENLVPASSRAAPAFSASARRSPTPPMTTSGKCARPGFHS